MKKSAKIVSFIASILIVLVSMIALVTLCVEQVVKSRCNDTVKTDTIIEYRYDTIYSDPIEIEKYRYLVRVEHDTVLTTDSVSVIAEIPIEQKKYASDLYSTSLNDTISYVAYVSGYRASLDSVRLFCRDYNQTLVRTITKNKKWNFGITAGLYTGYDLAHQNFGTGVGILAGLTYNF